MSVDISYLAEAIRDGREHYRSDTAQAQHAADIARRLAQRFSGLDPAAFVMAAMPTAWVGTRHANTWERTARQVAST